MAGLFYLPRLFVYHTRASLNSEADDLFKIMEHRLLAVIMRPAALVTIISGGFLVWMNSFAVGSPWLLAKLLGVVLLLCYHGLLERYQKLFAIGWRGRSERYFRAINEVPTILLVWIVVWVIVKPFT